MRFFHRTFLSAVLLLGAVETRAFAQLVWDPDGNLTSDGGDGNWDTSSSSWLNGGSPTSWSSGSDAVFGKKVDGSTSVVTIPSFEVIEVRNITLEAPNGTGAVNLVSGFDGSGPVVSNGGGTWELGGRTLHFVNNNDSNDTALFMTSGDTLTITDSSGGGVFNTGEKPGGATWGVGGATLDIQDGVTLRGTKDSVGQFANVVMSDGSEFIFERNQDQVGTNSLSNNWQLTGAVTFDNRFVRGYQLSGVASGSGSMVLDDLGGSFVRLTGNNTFTGGIVIDSSTTRSELQLNADSTDASFGAVPGVTDADNITLRNGGELKMTGITVNSNRGMTLDGGGIIVLNNSKSQYGGTISGTGGLQIGRSQGSDANSLVLTSNTHTYTGDTRIFQGKLELGIDNAIPTDHVLTIGGKGASRLDTMGYDQEIGGLRTAANNTRQVLNEGGSVSTLTINTAEETSHTYSGNFNGSDSVAIVKNGLGTQIFNKSANGGYATTPSAATVNAGRLRFSHPVLDDDPNSAGSPTTLVTTVTANNGGTLVIDAGDATPNDGIGWDQEEIDVLMANATFNAGSILGINTGAGDFSYTSNITGNQGLYKIQTNTLTLTGTNTYAGSTFVENGTLMADSPAALPNTGLSVEGTEGSGFIGFNLDNWSDAQVDSRINDVNTTFEPNAGVELGFSSASSYTEDIPSFVTNFAVSGTSTLSTDVLTLTGNNTYTGETVVRIGALKKGSANSVPSGTLLTLGVDDNAARFVMNGFDQVLSGLESTSTANVEFAADSVSPVTVTIDLAEGERSAYSGRMGGATAINDNNFRVVKNGAGTQEFNGQNSYFGTTTINAGRLVLKQPLDASALNPGDVSVATGAEVVLEGGGASEWSDLQMQAFLSDQTFAAGASFGIRTNDEDFTFSGVVSGDKSFLRTAFSDDVVLTLTAAQTYTGETRVSRGRLKLSVANNLPTSTVVTIGTPNSGARVLMNGFDQEIAGLVSGGSGNGARQWSNDSATFATLTINVGTGESYEYFHSLGESGNANMSNFGLTKSGAGSQTINQAFYTGATNVTAGTLLVAGNASEATGDVTVSSGATFGGTGTIGGAVSALSGSSISPGTSPGTLSLLSDLNLNAGASLDFELVGFDQTVGSGINDHIDMTAATGALTLNGTLNVSDIVTSPADFNSDGAVDALDLALWQDDYGVNADSDADGDGDTDGADFFAWQRDINLSSGFENVTAGTRWTLISFDDANVTLTNGLTLGTLPSLSGGLQFSIDTSVSGEVGLLVTSVLASTAVVPEPNTCMLLVIGGLGFVVRRRR